MAGAGRVMTGKVAVITGAAEGIGAGLVAGYRGRGWSVLASATILRPPNEPEVLAVEGDIADPAGSDRVIDAALERFGRLEYAAFGVRVNAVSPGIIGAPAQVSGIVDGACSSSPRPASPVRSCASMVPRRA